MKGLYVFWSSFLIHHFSATFYGTFRQVAFEDALQGERLGLESLYQFYASCRDVQGLDLNLLQECKETQKWESSHFPKKEVVGH